MPPQIYKQNLLILIFLLHGCISHQPPEFQDTKYPGQTSYSPINKPNSQQAIDPILFFTRLNSKHTKLTQQEHFFLKKMSQEKDISNGEFNEALLALGVLHLFITNKKNTHNFTEEDIFTSETIQSSNHLKKKLTTDSKTLEQLALNYKIDLITALQYNSYLQNLSTYRRFFLAIQYEKESLISQHLMVVIKKATLSWLKLAKTVQSITQDDIKTLSIPQIEETLINERTVQPPLPYENSQFNDLHFEKNISHINNLISKKDYAKAIKILSTINKDHLQYNMIKEKIKETSNLAVQELRKQAADSFGKAIPITDLKARAIYLKKSQNLLLKALTQYPEASNIETIRKNLHIINKNLELIRAQQKSNS